LFGAGGIGLLYRVYVDEAGNRGISKTSSCYFVVSAIVVADPDETELRRQLNDLRLALGRHSGHVLHFQNFSHSHRLKAAQDIASSSVATIINVIVHKDLRGQPSPSGAMGDISRPDPLYLWALRLLVERISWFVHERGGEAIVTFAHLKGFRTQKLHEYRRALEESGDVGARWRVFSGHPFRVQSPKSAELLQLADTTASALFQAIEPDQFGNTERRYLDVLAPKIYRRDSGRITSYGLKVFPTPIAEEAGALALLTEI
jgi:hypothetical protein